MATETLTRTEQTRNDTDWFRPDVDIYETADEVVIVADMPGTSAQDIDVNFERGVLTLHGKVKERQTKEARFWLDQYEVGDFHRSFEVSRDINPDGITADYRNGVLTLRLPKAAAAKPRKIEVRVHDANNA